MLETGGSSEPSSVQRYQKAPLKLTNWHVMPCLFNLTHCFYISFKNQSAKTKLLVQYLFWAAKCTVWNDYICVRMLHSRNVTNVQWNNVRTFLLWLCSAVYLLLNQVTMRLFTCQQKSIFKMNSLFYSLLNVFCGHQAVSSGARKRPRYCWKWDCGGRSSLPKTGKTHVRRGSSPEMFSG